MLAGTTCGADSLVDSGVFENEEGVSERDPNDSTQYWEYGSEYRCDHVGTCHWLSGPLTLLVT